MPHMVIYRKPAGKQSYEQSDSLEAAVAYVERLRNEEHVSDARIFELSEVPIEFKTYYRVEVASPPAAVLPPPLEAPPSVGPMVDGPVTGGTGEMTGPTPVPVANNGRFGLFGRG